MPLVFPLVILMAMVLACGDSWIRIKGAVVDEFGKPMSEVEIVVKQGDSKVGEQITDSTGKIDCGGSVCPIPGCTSDVSLTVSKKGYQTVVKDFDGKAESDSNTLRGGDLKIVLMREVQP